MAVLVCLVCGFARELAEEHLGQIIRCPSCEKPAKVLKTAVVVNSLIERLKRLQGEINELRQATQITAESSPQWGGISGYAFAHTAASQQLTNTQAAVEWFKARKLDVEIDPRATDISGFFDEIAVALGDDFDLLGLVLDKINFAYRKEFSRINIALDDYSQEEISRIKNFCRELYEAAFVAKYFRNKGEKQVQLTLQANQPTLKNFFAGDWLEWYAFMKIATLLTEAKRPFSCLKNFTLRFPNGDRYELDLFFLVEGKLPLWVECKSGEFRSAIGKYAQMREQLKIGKENMLLLALDLPDDRVAGMCSTFNSSIRNHHGFLEYVNGLLR